jgi:hypothetical protein
MSQSKFEKVKSIIESCETYDQIKTCFSFVNVETFFPDVLERFKVLRIIQSKAYALRNADLKFHNQEIKRIFSNV